MVKKKHEPSFRKFDDESDNEDFSDEEKHSKMDTEIGNSSARSNDELFFFTEDDPRLRSGAAGKETFKFYIKGLYGRYASCFHCNSTI